MARTGRPPLPFDEGYRVEPNGCWVWIRSCDTRGYGGYRGKRAHRYSFERANGPIPEGLEVCHSCDNKPCVNPDHLWLGTHQQNMADASAKKLFAEQKKTHCPRGHEYTPENTYVVHKTGRACRECGRARCRAYYQARKAAA